MGVIVASAGSAMALALSGAPTAVAANQALFLNGLAAGELTNIVMAGILHGEFSSYTRTAVSWPEQARPYTGKDSLPLGDSVAIGVTNLNQAVATALTQIGPGEHVTVVGLSAGSLVADEYARELIASGNAPDKSQLNFVVIADGNRLWSSTNRYDKILDYTFLGPPVTQYDTTVVTGEYDGFADFPDRPWNLLADLNAVAGMVTVHIPGMFTDLSTVPAENITTTTNSLGGVTTSYLVPSATLPLVKLVPALKPQEAVLKKIIDKGYRRNDKAAASATSVSVSASPSAAATGSGSPVTNSAAPTSNAANRAAGTGSSLGRGSHSNAAKSAAAVGGKH